MPRPNGHFLATKDIPVDFNFPHMLPRERGMFRTWLHSYGQDFDGFMFDVKLGQGRPPTLTDIVEVERQLGFPLSMPRADQEELDTNIRAMWQSLTAKRADAIGFRGADTWLIEVKKVFNMSLLGQLDIYATLLLRDFPPDGSLIRAAVVGDVDPDVGPSARARGIQIYRV